MTIYNAAPWLQRTLDSLFAQTFRDFELVAVENGSTDGSRAILEACGDPRLRLLALPQNIGRTPALRHGFERARGEYLAVLDADDLNGPERLRREVEFLDAHPDVVLVGTWTDFIDAGDRVVGQYRPPADSAELIDVFGGENPIVHSSCMYRAADAAAVGGYPEDLPHSQDLGLWLKLLRRGKAAIIAEPLCQFRVITGGGGMTQSRRNRIDVARDQLKLLRTVRETLPLSRTGRRRNREELAISRARYAWALAQQRQFGRAFVAGAGALFADPLALLNNRVTRAAWQR